MELELELFNVSPLARLKEGADLFMQTIMNKDESFHVSNIMLLSPSLPSSNSYVIS
jgi:hypothetical protein